MHTCKGLLLYISLINSSLFIQRLNRSSSYANNLFNCTTKVRRYIHLFDNTFHVILQIKLMHFPICLCCFFSFFKQFSVIPVVFKLCYVYCLWEQQCSWKLGNSVPEYSLLPPCRFWESNSGPQAWQKVSLPLSHFTDPCVILNRLKFQSE